MKSHSKCDECVRYSSLLAGMVGKVDGASNANRAAIRELSSNHMLEMGEERQDVDDTGYGSMVFPASGLALIGDAATQNNFILPKIPRTRMPKEMHRKPLFCSKLYGVFMYGVGMSCYLVHETIGAGANLSCTCIYLSLLRARKEGRPLPQTLHLQLDNTTGENKCWTVFCFAAWIVKKG